MSAHIRLGRGLGVSLCGLVLAMASCRAVVGIDPDSLTFADAASSGDDASGEVSRGDDAAVDAPGHEESDSGATHDAGTHTPDGASPDANSPERPEASVPEAAAPEAAMGCAASGSFSACTMCCRSQLMTQNGLFEMYLRSTSCICNGAACTTECSTSSCANPPGGQQSTCPPCLDSLVQNNDCSSAIAMCNADMQCKSIAQCLESCQ